MTRLLITKHPNHHRSLLAWLCTGFLWFVVALPQSVLAQSSEIDSLRVALVNAQQDSTKLEVYRRLGFAYIYSDPDSTQFLAQEMLALALTQSPPTEVGNAYNLLGISYDIKGQLDSALHFFHEYLEWSETQHDIKGKARATNNLSIAYHNLGEYTISLDYALQSYRWEKELDDTLGAAEALTNAAFQLIKLNLPDSANWYFNQSNTLFTLLGGHPSQAYNEEGLAELALEAEDYEDIIMHAERAMRQWEMEDNQYHQASSSILLGLGHLGLEQMRPAKSYLTQGLDLANEMEAIHLQAQATLALSQWHELNGQPNKALAYFKQHNENLKASFDAERAKQVAILESRYETNLQNKTIATLNEAQFIKDEKIRSDRQVRNILFVSIGLLAFFLIFMIRNYWRSVRTNKMLEIKKEEIKKKNLEIVHQKYKALRASKAKSRFLAMMSHEIRTPMNAVIGITNLLLQENPRRDQEESLQTMKFSAESLLVLINDILDYNKIEAGKIEFEDIPFDFGNLIKSLHNTLVGKANEKGLQLVEDLDSQLPQYVLGDPTRLAQILTNLISNAIKFTETGYVKLNVELVGETDEKFHLAFTVSDTGIGISKEKLGTIFNSFTQATSDITRRYGGTGLGLSITKKLIELQGSRIRVESEPGRGTEFYFTLSFERTAIRPAAADGGLRPLRDLTGVRILLAEDNPVNELVARRFLNKWGIQVESVSDGQQAVSIVQEQPFDLILMDLQMPVLDGFKATRKIRSLANQSFQSLPIIALTASAMNEIRHKAFEAGVTDFIAKPFNPDELRSVVEKYVLHDDPELIDG